MIIDFKSIGHDFYGKVEQPVLTLKTPDGRVISTISNYSGLKPTFRFNDVSEIEFSVPAYFHGELNNGYDEVSGMRLVEVEPYGDFVLVNPVVNNEGGRKETKTCKAYSLEYQFNYKKAEIPAGTYNFYNPVDNSNTIAAMIIELMPDWSFGQIDRELIGRWRTFENVDEVLYSFMMNTLQESYNCLFLFDTFNKKINVISASRTNKNLPIYLSYNNLLKSVEITELSDDVITALSGYGSGEGVDIRAVNPNGTNTIYNLDYFISKGDLPSKLANKWTTYKDSLESKGKIYSNLGVLYIQKDIEKELAKSKLAVLETDRDAAKETYLTASTQDKKDPNYDEEIAKLKANWDNLEAQIKTQQSVIDIITKDLEALKKQRADIVAVCKLESYFTSDEIKILNPYFKQDSIVNDTFVVPTYSSSVLPTTSVSLKEDNGGKVELTGAEMYATNIAQIFAVDENGVYQPYTTDDETGEQTYNPADSTSFHGIEIPQDVAQTVADQQNDAARKNVYGFRGGKFEFAYSIDEVVNGVKQAVNAKISGDIVTVDFHHNVDNLITYKDSSSPDTTKIGFFMLSATLRNATYQETTYPNMNVSMSGMLLSEIPQVGKEFVSFEIKDAILNVSASNTEYQKQAVIQELYDYVEETLDKLAFPSYEFSVNSANFIFAQEFAAFKDSLELGSTINLTLDDNEDDMLQPILIEVGLNYDNETDFTIKFSNKYRSSSSEFQLADLITDMNRTTHSSKLNSGDYRAYTDSKAGSQVSALTNSALDVVKNKIVNSANQAIEWDSTGMFFRRSLANGSFDDKQIGIINDNIAFTKDNWNSVEIAIGAYEDSNVGEQYGIIAPAIIGTLLAGENLVIENENKSFKFDGTGAWLYNSSMAFVQDADPNPGGNPGGKILIDPRYGIAAGNMNLFTVEGTNPKPSFMDENGKIIWDENKSIVNEDGTSQYYVPLNTQFFFDINTGNAYFGGTLNAENVVAGTLHGSAIKEGTLPLKSVDGLDAYLSQLDGRIQTYSQSEDPSAGWTSEDDKNNHIGDIWYDTDKNLTKRWNGLSWDTITDSVLEGLAKEKAQVFTAIPPSFPTPPYAEGDLWVQGNTGDIKHCIRSKDEGASFSEDDWEKSSKYTNDDYIKNWIEDTYSTDLKDINNQLDKKAETWYQATDPILEWSNDELESRVGDLWHYTGETGIVNNVNRTKDSEWVWRKVDGRDNTYEWQAMNVSEEVFDAIDGKSTIYVTMPASQDKGDLLIPSESFESVYNSETYIFTAQHVYKCAAESDTFRPDYWTEVDYADSLEFKAFLKGYDETLKDINNQLDKKTNTYYQSNMPHLEYSNVAENDTYNSYIGDLWYDTDDGKTYIYQKESGNSGTYNYKWEFMNVPEDVFDKIDGVASIYVVVPENPVEGDLLIPTDTTKTDNYLAGKVYRYDGSSWIEVDYTDNAAVQKAKEEAEKVATNFMKFNCEYGDGLTIGDLQGDTLGRNAYIDAEGFYIRNGGGENATILASFNEDEIWLGNQTDTSTIYLCRGIGSIYSEHFDDDPDTEPYDQFIINGSEHFSIECSNSNENADSGAGIAFDCIYIEDEESPNIAFSEWYAYYNDTFHSISMDEMGIFMQGTVNTSSYLFPGTNLYLINGYRLRGMKSGYSEASIADSNIISWIGDTNRVGLGAVGNSSATEVRSPYAIYLKANGTTLDESRYTVVVSYGTTDDDSGRGYFMPGYNTDGGSSYTNLGGSNHKWRNVYATNGAIETSDRNAKRDIQSLSEKYLDMFDLLQPVSYKMIEGDRTHVGFIAQDVEEAMNHVGLSSNDFAGLCKDIKYTKDIDGYEFPVVKDDGKYEYLYSLRYSEFIPIATAKIKQLEQLVLQLQYELKQIKGDN